jgi:alkanesulfonate monooxygenase SsuD/methylene tetrahydromethanopterin reductase-like flavin-dependent oxidoreductase (luciferase family)
MPESDGSKSIQAKLLDQARAEDMTLRDLYLRYAIGFGNRRVIGTAMQVADLIEESFEGEAVDGFAISCAMLPGSLKDFAELVAPELQRRGLLRKRYSGSSLRETLGLRRPAHPAQRDNSHPA